jgi:hypothetical protein
LRVFADLNEIIRRRKRSVILTIAIVSFSKDLLKRKLTYGNSYYIFH